MKINIDEILKQQGKTRYWLSKQIGFTYPNLVKLCNNETSSIRFDILYKICIALNCTPNDIFNNKLD
jgi:putative transcriptional regulator